MTRSLAYFVVVVSSLVPACFGAPPDGGGSGDPLSDPECQLDTEREDTPGYPYDVQSFTDEVLPVVSGSCALGGCHGAPQGNGDFTVWKDAQPGDCNFGKTFNNVVRKIDLATPANSRIVAAVSGGSATHPFSFAATDTKLSALQAFINDAKARYDAGGGGVTPPPGPSPFNYTVYQSTIQTAINTAGCAASGCHGSGAGGFSLKAQPAAASADMEANFVAVTSRTNLETPASSTVYVRATVKHASGQSTQLTPDSAAAMLAWIEDAKQNAGGGGGGGGNPTCAPIDKFNIGVFRSEILPILAGDLDLNVPGGQGSGAGCMSSACHGTNRGPGALSLEPNADPADLLQNFACFVNLAAPSTSEILACPLNDPRCRRYPHPGQDVLQGANDLNYQKLLAYVYGAKVEVSPLDFAFFVRRINPIFNDNLAVENGAQGRSCSDATACHGVSVAGQAPPNGSDFPIIPNASDIGRLSYNYVSATGFVNFLNPGESSLFLYPTDEIANRDAHPLATGLPHPGGPDFAVDSDFALAILQWAGGLRPDGNGLLRNWLVAGDFAATRVSDQTLLDETTVVPQIFDLGFGAFNSGQWDGLFSDRGEVDLNVAFPRAATSGRVGYAVTYAINTVPRQIVAQMTVSTNNPIRIYVDGLLVAQNDQGGGATALVTLPPAGPTAQPKRIMIKVLQRANDARFAFTAELRDELGTLLTDRTGELVFTLGPKGGI
jgi:hypothetical protein